MNKLGLIVRADLGSGLQSQTYNLYRLLNPDRVMIIDSYIFNEREQHHYLYENSKDVIINEGFVNNINALKFLDGLDSIMSAETFYSHHMVELANKRRIFSVQQYNWEFLEHHQNRYLPFPSLFLSPSYWYLDKIKTMFRKVEYLPPPIFLEDFEQAYNKNIERNGPFKILHILGTYASNDRNGTKDLLESLKYTKSDFELTIRCQKYIPELFNGLNDKRVKVVTDNIKQQVDMYKDFDIMILPRRYGGLCLPMNEALACGLPVIMSDMEPNNRVLPSSWLIDSQKYSSFFTRTVIDVHQVDVVQLAERIDHFVNMPRADLQAEKHRAMQICIENYASDTLKPRYEELFNRAI